MALIGSHCQQLSPMHVLLPEPVSALGSTKWPATRSCALPAAFGLRSQAPACGALPALVLAVEKMTAAPGPAAGHARRARAPRAGWQHHPVSTRRMHFVVPATQGPRSLADPGALPALVEARLAGRPAAAAPAPAPPAACGDGEEEEDEADGGGASPYIAPASVFDSPRHLLHGVLHQNGFGHLLRVNGCEGGSAALSGARAACRGTRHRRTWAPRRRLGAARWGAALVRRRSAATRARGAQGGS
jgi:hypothetical protein